MKITSITARQILDCKTRPLVEVEVVTEDGTTARGAAPTGSSVGMHEAHVLRDADPARFHGLSVYGAVDNVINEIAPALVGMDVMDQAAIDQRMIELDGTPNKERLGGNAIYSTSIATLRAAAATAGVQVWEHVAQKPVETIPVPSFNMINGGRYGDLVQPFNEFLVMPYKAPTVEAALEMSIDVFETLHGILENYLGYAPTVASSYGYAAPSSDPKVVLSLLRDAVEKAGYSQYMAFALDCASSEMYDKDSQTYLYDGERIDNAELVGRTRELTEQFDLLFIEDLLDENDWSGFSLAKSELGRTIILGDDLIVTQRDKLEKAQAEKAVDGFILKPNQVGTITESLETFQYAKDQGLLAIPSGRSGGVIDDIVMDLSVGLEVPFQKNGAPRSGERIEKLNFLLRVADKIKNVRLADVAALAKF